MGKPTEQRKAEIIQATLTLATRQGVARVTTLAIAEEVGISHATVFRHFKNREEIFAASLNWIVENMFANVGQHFASEEPADIRLHGLINSQLQFVSKHRGLPRLLFSDRLHMESATLKNIVKHAMKQFTSNIAGLISQGMDEGVFRADLEPLKYAGHLIALFQGLMMRWSVFDFDFPIENEVEPLWQFYFRALKPD